MNKPIRHLPIAPRSGEFIERSGKFRHLIYSLLPRYVLFPLKREFKLIPLKLRQSRVAKSYRNAKDLLVNIGAGGMGVNGWGNVDCYPAPGINCVYDSRKSLPFTDCSVRGIFCEHFFEHLDYTEEVPYFLSECLRVLTNGGVLRLIVPDTEIYLQAYAAGGWDTLSKVRPLNSNHWDAHADSTYNTRMELINMVFRSAFDHRFAYDFETISFVLNRFGFGRVIKQSYGNCLLPKICLDQQRRASESLYVDAVKEA
jgi:predicted SAM-dependent methyltransferase